MNASQTQMLERRRKISEARGDKAPSCSKRLLLRNTCVENAAFEVGCESPENQGLREEQMPALRPKSCALSACKVTTWGRCSNLVLGNIIESIRALYI